MDMRYKKGKMMIMKMIMTQTIDATDSLTNHNDRGGRVSCGSWSDHEVKLYINISFEEFVDSVTPHEEDIGQIFILLKLNICEEGMTQMLTTANECPCVIRPCSTWRTVDIFRKSCVTFRA
jgi:hypothetical protein